MIQFEKERTMTQAATAHGEKLLYTAKTHTTGGRENGRSRSSDGRLDIRLSVPGAPPAGPIRSSFLQRAGPPASKAQSASPLLREGSGLPADVAINAEVDLNTRDGGYFLRARLNVSIPGADREIGKALLDEAETLCPYSKATRGNIDVAINLV
jgi:lipoyl-dependent peroxiredoxin